MKIEAKLLFIRHKLLVNVFYKRAIIIDDYVYESKYKELEAYQLTFTNLNKILKNDRIDDVVLLGKDEMYFNRIKIQHSQRK